MRLIFRADAIVQMGTGHVMRCLSLAQALAMQGGKAMFASADMLPSLQAQIHHAEFPVVKIDAIAGTRQDAEAVARLAVELKADCVVVDGYQFGGDYQHQLKQASHLPLLLFDDFGHASRYTADWVLNQNLSADPAWYQNRAETSELLLGSNYVVLGQAFKSWQGWQRCYPAKAKHLLITLGGADPHNVTAKVLDALALLPHDTAPACRVIVGGANPNREALIRQAAHLPNVSVLSNVSNMPEQMAWADMAIAAGGTTSWELAFMGLPSLVLTCFDNQEAIARKLGETGLALSLGWYDRLTEQALAEAIGKLAHSRALRQQLSQAGRKAVDGLGADRVLAILQRKIKQKAASLETLF